MELRRLAEDKPPARRSYLLSIVDELAALNRANDNPYHTWQALVTDNEVEIIRANRKNPNLD